MHKTKTKALIKALRILARDIQSDDGVANMCVSEAADRLQEFNEIICNVRERLDEIVQKNL